MPNTSFITLGSGKTPLLPVAPDKVRLLHSKDAVDERRYDFEVRGLLSITPRIVSIALTKREDTSRLTFSKR